jgi:hypothetical protein
VLHCSHSPSRRFERVGRIMIRRHESPTGRGTRRSREVTGGSRSALRTGMNRIGCHTIQRVQLPDTAQPWQMISFRLSRASSSSKLSPAFELP